MAMIELALVLIYTCVLLIKTCNMSADVCVTFGFGKTAEGTRTRTPDPCSLVWRRQAMSHPA
eukprot:4852048-Prymnesium_polylepis.2